MKHVYTTLGSTINQNGSLEARVLGDPQCSAYAVTNERKNVCVSTVTKSHSPLRRFAPSDLVGKPSVGTILQIKHANQLKGSNKALHVQLFREHVTLLKLRVYLQHVYVSGVWRLKRRIWAHEFVHEA